MKIKSWLKTKAMFVLNLAGISLDDCLQHDDWDPDVLTSTSNQWYLWKLRSRCHFGQQFLCNFLSRWEDLLNPPFIIISSQICVYFHFHADWTNNHTLSTQPHTYKIHCESAAQPTCIKLHCYVYGSVSSIFLECGWKSTLRTFAGII